MNTAKERPHIKLSSFLPADAIPFFTYILTYFLAYLPDIVLLLNILNIIRYTFCIASMLYLPAMCAKILSSP